MKKISSKSIIILLFLLVNHEREKKNIPYISIFIPIYNKQDYIGKTISLLLNQTLKNIEIIAINDCSNDKSYEILKAYSLKDKRIKIINNTKNFGVLYSRAMGVIHSTGEYLINLDADDQFKDFDSLEYLYYNAKRSKADIVFFSFLVKSEMKIYNGCNKFNRIIRQPKLFQSYFKMKNTIVGGVVWNKLIKRKIYLKAYKLYENYIYYKKWNYHEDNIWNLLIFKSASSKICLNSLNYIYNNNVHNKSIMKTRGGILEYINIIYRFEISRKVLTDATYLNYLSNECSSLINQLNNSEIFRSYMKISNYLKNITIYNLEICIKSYNISPSHKSLFFNLVKSF